MRISVLTPTIRPEGLQITQECLKNQSFQDFEWLTEVGLGKHDLNAAYNRMLKRANGELIISLQDYIKISDDGLEKFWNAYQENKSTCFTAPVGKTLDWKEVTYDWRDSHADCDWVRWEIDWAAAPKEMFYNIGGFDEELDKYWSSDNVNVGYRAYLHGYEFKNLRDNKAVAFDHDKTIEHPFRKNYNPTFNNERMNSFSPGEKLPYL